MSLTHTLTSRQTACSSDVMVFIDRQIDQYLTLALGVTPEADVILLDPAEDGVEQILQILATRPQVAAIHIFSHAEAGSLSLGNTKLNTQTLDRYARLPDWRTAFSDVDLFLYGCNLAEGEAGATFLQKLHTVTGARIAASTTRTGSAALNGDWELQVQIGQPKSLPVLQPEAMAAFSGVLATITVDNTNDSGAGSLRAAIANAQSGDTIVFASTLASQTITLTGGQIEIPLGKNLIIDGAGAAGLTISGNNASRIFNVNSGIAAATNLTVKNLTLANGYTNDRGGAIATTHRGVLNVENVTFNNNVADKGGGAIFGAFEGSVSVTGSRFNNNVATAGNDERGAGAIAFWGPGALTVNNSEFVGNKGINGAAINSLNGRLTVENSRFINNDTSAAQYATGQPNGFIRGYGGAIYTDRANDTTIIRNSVFEGNSSKAAGGAVHLFSDPEDVVTIDGSQFRNNQATGLPGGEGGKAGAITQLRNSLGSGSFTLSNSSIIDNTANDQGGGLWVNNTRTTISNSTFSGNKLLNTDFSSVGGAMTLYSPTEIINTTIANNTAGWSGGGVGASGDATVSVKNTIFYNNTANNPYKIQYSTSKPLIDNGGNIQFPPKATNLGNDFNATNTITLVDPKLGSLQNINGTWVYPLLEGSPAINTGVAGAPLTDERGFTRDGQPDVGAFEFGGTIPTNPLGTLSISDVSLTEGNTGTANAVFTVSLSAASTQAVTVNYATANGTGTAGSDYTALTGTLTFNPGQTTQTIAVPVVGDTLTEANETFFVNLSNPGNAILGDSQGLGTIVNDDAAAALPTLSIGNITLNEGNTGTSNAVFTVSLSAASAQQVNVSYATADGTATAGTDYTALNGSLSFNPGETSKTITIPIVGDSLVETNETFSVNLSAPTNATLATAQGIGTITNDDLEAPTLPSLSIDSISLAEGNSGTTNAIFTVSLSQASQQAVTVAYASADGTAIAGTDYTALSGNLSFNPGETSKTISVAILSDSLAEGNEIFSMNLGAPTNASLGTAQGIGTILNDDVAVDPNLPKLTIQDVSFKEGNKGKKSAVFTVSLSGASKEPVSVAYSTSNGTAIAGSDYTGTSGMLRFKAGELTKKIKVAIRGDKLVEESETFHLDFSSPSNAALVTNRATGTILNDDMSKAAKNGAAGKWATTIVKQPSLTGSSSGFQNQQLTTAMDNTWRPIAS